MPFDSAINALATRVATEFKAVYTALNGKASVLTGEIKMWPTGTAPTGYLLCQGGTFSSVTYPALAALLGDTFGTHSGTTYYLPDWRGRSPIGAGSVVPAQSGNAYSLGQKYGHEAMQTHTHVQNAHSHGIWDPGHAHAEYALDWYAASSGPSPVIGHTGARQTGWSSVTGISINNATATNQNAGAGNAQNVHPVLGINFIIKI